jgi:ABC-type lipoprotein export system ATPase subunit
VSALELLGVSGAGERNLLLVDEPPGALDSVNVEAVMRPVRAAYHRAVVAAVVTHEAQLESTCLGLHFSSCVARPDD